MSKKATYVELEQRVKELEEKAFEPEHSREALRRSEALFRDLVEKLPFPIAVATAALETKYMNPRFTEVFGYSASEIPDQKACREKLMPNSAYRLEKSFEKILLSSGYSINGQAREILKRGCNGFIQKPFNLKQLSQKIS